MNADHTRVPTRPVERLRGDPADLSADMHFDDIARACHGTSLQRLSGRAQARLAQAQRPAAPAPGATQHRLAWGLPAVFATLAVLAVAVQLRPHPSMTPTTPAPAVAVTGNDAASGDPAAALDENPDFYLWLASSDDVMPTTPEY